MYRSIIQGPERTQPRINLTVFMGDHVALTSPFMLGWPMLHANIVLHLRAAPNSTCAEAVLNAFIGLLAKAR
jgi:hypothetical protein